MQSVGSRGRSRRSAAGRAARADGSQECLLSIPRWDFNWQSSYSFAEPIEFHPGDQLHLECEWNNEAGAETVNWGDGTADEMCLGVYYVTAL
jgi:hypothetical protein